MEGWGGMTGPETDEEAVERIKAKWAWIAGDDEDVGPSSADLYSRAERSGHLNRLVVRRYICRNRGCKLATVIRYRDRLLLRTQPYKLAPGKNAETSNEISRAISTIDGDRFWPGETFDVVELAVRDGRALIDVNCRHALHQLDPRDVLVDVESVGTGHPGAPRRI